MGRGLETAVLGRIVIKLTTFGEWYRKSLAEVKELQEDLFGGIGFDDEEWISLKVPEKLVDDVNSGFCFGDLEFNDLKKHEGTGLRALFHHPRLKGRFGSVVSGQFILNAVGCHDFLRRSEFVRSILAPLLHMSPGGTSWGTEFAALYLRNSPQGDIRNVRVIDGELCLIGGYNKTSSRVSLFPEVPLWSSTADFSVLDREHKYHTSFHSKKHLPPLHCRLVSHPAGGARLRCSSRT